MTESHKSLNSSTYEYLHGKVEIKISLPEKRALTDNEELFIGLNLLHKNEELKQQSRFKDISFEIIEFNAKAAEEKDAVLIELNNKLLMYQCAYEIFTKLKQSKDNDVQRIATQFVTHYKFDKYIDETKKLLSERRKTGTSLDSSATSSAENSPAFFQPIHPAQRNKVKSHAPPSWRSPLTINPPIWKQKK